MDRLVQAIILVEDLDVAQDRMTSQGFAVERGGRHPGRGTANLIVPFGDQYVELLAVVDESQARSSPQGRPVLRALSRLGPGLARWSVEPSDAAATARRLGLSVQRRQRVRPDGRIVHWRAVGVDEAWEQPWRCAYMVWDDEELHPGRRVRDHPNGATGFARLEVGVPDEEGLLAWLGGALPPAVDVRRDGTVGPTGLFVSTPSGPIKVG